MADRNLEYSDLWADVEAPEPAGWSGEPDHELNCSSCGAELAGAELFEHYHVCPGCGRHFPVPARERLALLIDPDSFVETNATLVSADPVVFRDDLPAPDRLAEAHERSALADAVITGSGAIGGREAMLIVLDFSFQGSSIGLLVGEKLALAMEHAAAKRLPLVAVCSGGGARTQAGLLSLFQVGKVAAAATRLRREGLPIISVLTHPTTGGVYVGLANQADIVLAESGARIGLRPAPEARLAPATDTAESLLARGMIDAVVLRTQLRRVLAQLLDLFTNRGRLASAELLERAPGAATPSWEALGLARHPERPTALDYIRRLMPEFVELHGDRAAADDPAIVTGLGRLAGVSVAVVAHERGRADGSARAAGYRKAARIMRLASRLELPLLTLIDTLGAASDDDGGDIGIGVAIAQALNTLCLVRTPVISVVLSEGAGLGALALGIGDRALMLEHAVYSVAGRETATLVPHERSAERAAGLKLTARDCQRLGAIDAIVPEPTPAAHADPELAAHLLRAAIAQALADLPLAASRRLRDGRERRLRTIGLATPEGRETARREVTELQRWQRALARSFEDFRENWEARNLTLPRLGRNFNLHRPDLNLTDLAERFTAFKEGAANWRPELGRSGTEPEADRPKEPEG